MERVIDVRSIPRSRHNPQFDQETLRTLARNSFRAAFLDEAARERHLRDVDAHQA